ncbi:MAG: SDR family oxidoreductase [Deltaproteobacteria bacterium]|nr:SDR family oxidoreductase [Deltaproteobacteria bacterium]
MHDKIALVTGSSRGLGKDIALLLAQTVAGVVIHYRNEKHAAENTVGAIHKIGKKSAAFYADLTKEVEVEGLFNQAESLYGRIDILVNNVGPIIVKPWDKVTTLEWEDTLHSNLFSALFCMKFALPGMRKRQWGRIINLGYSRVEQLSAFPTITPYAVAKSGLLILTRTVAASEASAGITVNMVSPGLIEGGIMPKASDIPCGRLGKFEDVTQAVLYLVSPQDLVVAGGWKL